jgi:hypothetical protein
MPDHGEQHRAYPQAEDRNQGVYSNNVAVVCVSQADVGEELLYDVLTLGGTWRGPICLFGEVA